MDIKFFLRHFYLTSCQIVLLIKISKIIYGLTFVGKVLSILIDNLMLHLYGVGLSSRLVEEYEGDLTIGANSVLIRSLKN